MKDWLMSSKKNTLSRFIFFTIIPLLFISSCQKETYNSEKCNELSQKSFKGMPKAAKNLQDHCQGVSIKYTKEVCQKALNDLILSGDYPGVLKKYGKNVAGCLTENDIKSFRKR
jgi:hypothetical protein